MATPSFPTLQRGVNFSLLLGDGGGTEVFTTVCIATTLGFNRAFEFDDVMMIDCANPQNIPVRTSIAKGQTWDITFSGRCDFARYKTLEAVFDGAAHNWQIAKAGTGANGGGVYKGAAMLATLNEDKNDNGLVTFTATLKGQGLLAYTANA